ncbi:MAG: hypothetical protein ACRCZB_05545 [Bacteroidales bacterium]
MDERRASSMRRMASVIAFLASETSSFDDLLGERRRSSKRWEIEDYSVSFTEQEKQMLKLNCKKKLSRAERKRKKNKTPLIKKKTKH